MRRHQLVVLHGALGDGVQGVLQQVHPGPPRVRVKVHVPVEVVHVELEQLLILLFHPLPQGLDVCVLEVPLVHGKVGDDVAEFIDLLVALYQPGK